MGLLSVIKRRLFPPELCRVAKTGDVAATSKCIARTSLVVVGADLGESVPFDADRASVLKIVESAAQNKSFDGDILKYEIDGQNFLPIFADAPAAEDFCAAYCSLLGQIHAFRLFTIPGAYIRRWIADHDVIVVNPQNDNEVKIDCSKSRAIRECLPETHTLNDAHFVALVLPMAGISRPIEITPDS